MKPNKFPFSVFGAAVMLVLAGCNLPNTPTASPVLVSPPLANPTPLSDKPTPQLPSPTPTEITTPASPTPTLNGPAIQHLAAGQAIDITYIHMVDVDTGWGIGGLNKASDNIFRTQDGGATWRDITPPQPVPPPGVNLVAIGAFLDASIGWVAYGGQDYPPLPYAYVWYTQDGGTTWQYSAIDSSVSPEAFSPWFIDFVDGQHGWLMFYLGAGMSHNYVALFDTTDGGATWTDILDPYTDGGIQSFLKTGMVFVDAQTGWLARDGHGVDPIPHIFRTSDGGGTWERIDLPTPATEPTFYEKWACGTYSPNTFSAQSVVVAMKCLNVDDFKTEKDYVYSTTDGGSTWQAYLLPDTYKMGEGLLFLNPQTGLALGRKIFRTDNGGQTWMLAGEVFWDGQFIYMDIGHGWAVARNPDTGEIALVRKSSTDGPWRILHPVVAP
ncbi:MAG: hypothetical protein MUO30_15935 [Anaerolineales bacterium]|nr:hypothetical protein [Anaerolineales bacterium]